MSGINKLAHGARWAAAVLLLLASGSAMAAKPLTVAVAANVKFAFGELQQAFTRETGIPVRAAFGSSGKLTAQIESGAPFDVFLSANMKYPRALYDKKLATAEPKIYASGVLVLWSMKPLDLTRGMPLLVDPAVEKIALANPTLAPYGREAVKALDHFKLRGAVEKKLVYGESISQTSQYIDSGAVDVGFTAKSIVLAPKVKGHGHWVEVPRDSYQPISQGVVILKHGEDGNAEASKRFVTFLASPAARDIFRKYGYLLP